LLYALIFTDLLNLNGPIFNKFLSEGNGSVISRFASIKSNLYLAWRSPLFGIGLYNVENNFRELTYKIYGMYSDDNTNSILIAFAAHGIVFGLYCVYGIFKFVKQITRNSIAVIILFIVMILLFFSQNMSYSFMFYIIIAYGYYKNNNIYMEENSNVSI
jgi:hypothetical protein